MIRVKLRYDIRHVFPSTIDKIRADLRRRVAEALTFDPNNPILGEDLDIRYETCGGLDEPLHHLGLEVQAQTQQARLIPQPQETADRLLRILTIHGDSHHTAGVWLEAGGMTVVSQWPNPMR